MRLRLWPGLWLWLRLRAGLWLLRRQGRWLGDRRRLRRVGDHGRCGRGCRERLLRGFGCAVATDAGQRAAEWARGSGRGGRRGARGGGCRGGSCGHLGGGGGRGFGACDGGGGCCGRRGRDGGRDGRLGRWRRDSGQHGRGRRRPRNRHGPVHARATAPSRSRRRAPDNCGGRLSAASQPHFGLGLGRRDVRTGLDNLGRLCLRRGRRGRDRRWLESGGWRFGRGCRRSRPHVVCDVARLA